MSNMTWNIESNQFPIEIIGFDYTICSILYGSIEIVEIKLHFQFNLPFVASLITLFSICFNAAEIAIQPMAMARPVPWSSR